MVKKATSDPEIIALRRMSRTVSEVKKYSETAGVKSGRITASCDKGSGSK
jgi:hypothetical protein